MKDIILIGMPGCGKSTIGRQLAKKLGRPFLDLDAAIEEMAGRKISDIFATDGETGFRQIETETFQKAIGFGGVLATGGGIVVKEENQAIANQGVVIFIDRPLEEILGDIATEDRPLLAEGKEKLIRLHQERYEKYLAWARIHIKNTGAMADVIEKIIDEVKKHENYGN